MKKLKPDVSEFYKLVTIRPGTYSFPEFGSVDLTSISLEEAHDLVKNGFKFLVPKKKNIVTDDSEITRKHKDSEKTINHPEKPKNYLEKQNIPGVDEFENILYKAEQAGEDLRNIYFDAEDLNDALIKLIDKAENLGQKDLELFRDNKKFINKLLMLNYSDLTFKERSVFFHDEKYFNEKKFTLQEISRQYNNMKTLHARLKNCTNDAERKEINKALWLSDDARAQLFKRIDNWEHQEPKKESPDETAVRIALEKANEIKTITNYIGRFEESYSILPESNEKERAKKKKKIQQIEQRKARLIELGAPYKRKKRK